MQNVRDALARVLAGRAIDANSESVLTPTSDDVLPTESADEADAKASQDDIAHRIALDLANLVSLIDGDQSKGKRMFVPRGQSKKAIQGALCRRSILCSGK